MRRRPTCYSSSVPPEPRLHAFGFRVPHAFESWTESSHLRLEVDGLTLAEDEHRKRFEIAVDLYQAGQRSAHLETKTSCMFSREIALSIPKEVVVGVTSSISARYDFLDKMSSFRVWATQVHLGKICWSIVELVS